MLKKNGIVILGGVLIAAWFVHDIMSKARTFGERLKVKVVKITIPKITSNGTAEIPLEFAITNPQDIGVTINQFHVKISLQDSNGNFNEIGQADSRIALKLPPNQTVPFSIRPIVNFRNFNPFKGKKLLDVVDSVFGSGNLATLKINYSGRVENIPFDGETTKKVNVPGF